MTERTKGATTGDAAALIDRHGHTLVITINRPETRNAVNSSVSNAVGDALSRAQGDPSVWAVVLTGAGDKSFCAGADIKAVSRGENLYHPAHSECEAMGLTPWARIHTAVVVGDDPVAMLTAPIPATAKALDKSGLSLADIGTFEVNEAFAPVVLAWLKDTGASSMLTNSDGGAIALGHPLGASSARLMTTMLHRMRRDNIGYGLQTMCEGGGLANATILELL